MKTKLNSVFYRIKMHINKRDIHVCKRGIIYFLPVLFLFSCGKETTIKNPLFKVLDSKATGINFGNKLTPSPDFNLFTYMYYYNGSGIAAGDFNNDGLTDLFFSANQGENKLYINQGNLKFKDVTETAAIPQDGGWSTGVSVVDVNNDGLLDIYVCKVGQYKILKAKNQLLVCKQISKEGVPTFVDEAKEYGLDFSGFSTQASFFDYDLDGDLDMFLLNHNINHDGNYAPRENFLNTFDSRAGQKLYRNDAYINHDGRRKNYFADVTKESGINSSKIGYGLGVAVSDINLDGWPDFYVGNDFHENDYLYINQKNGTFADESSQRIMHTSQFSMGVDVADVTNDALPEIISVDMLPNDAYMLRRSLAEDDYNIFRQKIAYGYNYQYARNNLQFNRGNGLFSEAGQYAGIYATDWSWSALWMDFDNDGNKDLFISNGIPKRMNDIDYINFVSNDELQQKLRNNQVGDKDLTLTNKFPEIKIPNRFFQNKGDLFFNDITDSVQNNLPSFSNGAVYADLDNDGDLDIVVNNINDPVFIYANTTNDSKRKNFAAVKLNGPQNNRNAIGAKLVLFCRDGIRTYENNTVHGFQSSVLAPLHIGLDKVETDSSFIIWPDNRFEKINLAVNTKNGFSYKKNLPLFDYNLLLKDNKKEINTIGEVLNTSGINFRHIENEFNEFAREPLLPHMLSTEGPALAVADINGDGLDDFFIGASKTFHNAVYVQTVPGKFTELPQPEMFKDSMWENTSAVWADVNNDKKPDLIVASGGNEYYGDDEHLLPLLYLNDGKGNLSAKKDAFKEINVTQSIIAANDFNKDGHTDLFIGGRAVPWNYGHIPRSYLLQNDGNGRFTDVTKKYSPELMAPGMVTNGVWTDINNDNNKDLVICYQWGGVDAFISKGQKFVKEVICDKKGWWNFILPADLDNDGDTDFVAGNLGLNSKLKASEKEPVSLYVNDFDDNGKDEPVLTYYVSGEEIPFASKQELEKQMPFLKKKFLYAADFAKASIKELFGEQKLAKAEKLNANYFSNAIIINKGNGKYETIAMPFEGQLSPYKGAVIINANNDNLPDVLLVGNYYDNNVEIGRNDADFGSVLINMGSRKFKYHNSNEKIITGQARFIKPVIIRNQQSFLVARNNDKPLLLTIKNN